MPAHLVFVLCTFIAHSAADVGVRDDGHELSMPRFTAEPNPAELLSTCSMAGAIFFRNSSAPSAARTGAISATALISVPASKCAGLEAKNFSVKDA